MEGDPKKESKKSTLAKEITEAITSQDKQKLYAALSEINHILTGGNSGDFQDGVSTKQFLRDIDRFIHDAGEGFSSLNISLGDGGTSRLILWVENGRIDLDISPVSSEKVKRKWDELQSNIKNS
ncbi:MAG: hypothetical protein HYT98_04580 [Candidatus Sungbacteria bacterium]|nr:hypothetical protein [Candidatus Sungbacteria bacterium]